MRRARARPLPSPKTIIEEAAIAACKALNRQECPCARAPSVCEAMVSVVRAVIHIVRPELAESLAAAELAAAAVERKEAKARREA